MADRIRGNDIGPIGARVGDQVRRLRSDRGLTQEQLSSALSTVGRSIPTASIGRLESGTRKIDVDDLMALAYVLDVSPVAMLLPFTETPDDQVIRAGVGSPSTALVAWQWALGEAPAHYSNHGEQNREAEWRRFRFLSHPWWLTVRVDFNERVYKMLRGMPPIPPGHEGVDHLYDDPTP